MSTHYTLQETGESCLQLCLSVAIRDINDIGLYTLHHQWWRIQVKGLHNYSTVEISVKC